MKIANRTVKAGDRFTSTVSKTIYCVVTVHRNGTISYTSEKGYLTGSPSRRDVVNVSHDDFATKVFRAWMEGNSAQNPVRKAQTRNKESVAKEKTVVPVPAENTGELAGNGEMSVLAQKLAAEIRNVDHDKAIFYNLMFDIKQKDLNPENRINLQNYVYDGIDEIETSGDGQPYFDVILFFIREQGVNDRTQNLLEQYVEHVKDEAFRKGLNY